MLPGKPWKLDGVLRLGARVLICVFIGTLAGSVVTYFHGPQRNHVLAFLSMTAGAAILFGLCVVLLGRPWRLETFARVFFVLLACFYGALLLAWGSLHARGDQPDAQPSVLNVVVAVLSFQGATCALVSRFLRAHGIGWAEAFGFRIQWKRAVLFGSAGALAFLAIGLTLQSASIRLLERFHVEAKDQTIVDVLRDSTTLGNWVVLGVTAIVLAPLAEEMLFRGILYPAIKQTGHPRLALWGTSLAFAVIHFNLATFVPLLLLALILTWLYEATGNLLASITAHACFNALNFAMLFIFQVFHIQPPGS